MTKVTIYNEFHHERSEAAIAAVYPDGIHSELKRQLEDDDICVRTFTLDNVNDITDEVLADTDVLIWWGHVRHLDVPDEVAQRVKKCGFVRYGCGFSSLGSPFKTV